MADDEGLRELNRTIVRLGEELGIPVVATGDVHFLDPHNAINRAIIQAGLGYEDCDHAAAAVLQDDQRDAGGIRLPGRGKGHEVVIDNPRKIADQVDKLRLFPKHPKGEDTFQPFWPDAADNIQNMSWGTAKELVRRSAAGHCRQAAGKGAGLHHRLWLRHAVQHCRAAGAARPWRTDTWWAAAVPWAPASWRCMCGITEVNALPPHYRCPHCHKGFFDVDKSKYKVGVDLPDKDCPLCGRRPGEGRLRHPV